METKNVILDRDWLRIADGAGDATISSYGPYEWAIKPDTWVPVNSFTGHFVKATERSMTLEAGESLWVRSHAEEVFFVFTAANPVGV